MNSKDSAVIALIDYGAGNLRSVANAVGRLGYRFKVTDRRREVLEAPCVILPGVGAASDTIAGLKRAGLDLAIKELLEKKAPLLAVCVGLQVLFERTEEGGDKPCLGVLEGRVKKLPAGLKVPHMGWNQVIQMVEHPVFAGIPDGANFYFVHSYYGAPQDASLVAGITDYGIEFASVLAQDNWVATQFHPEKSGEFGLRFYDNFIRMALG